MLPLCAEGQLDVPLTKNYSGYMFSEFIREISEGNHLKFFYREKWVENIKISQLEPKLTVRNIFTQVLSKYHLSFIEYQSDNVIVLPDSYSFFVDDMSISFYKKVGNPIEKGRYKSNKVMGRVVMAKNGQPLSGAVVEEQSNHIHAVTNGSGIYEMELNSGKQTLTCSYVGLETCEIKVDILSSGELDIELQEESIALEGVTVTAARGQDNIEQVQMGMLNMDMKTLNKLPVLMGEPDIIKSLTLLPGVGKSGEMASGFNVRGGKSDQNLILLNDAPIYSTAHLFGLFSALIPGSVSGVKLHKGTQPASYGSRIASVTELSLKTPDTINVHGKTSIGVLNSSLFLEGPLLTNRVSFLFGVRSTYSNWLLTQIPDVDISRSKADFSDLIGEVHFNISTRVKLTAFGYGSQDNFSYSMRNKYNYGNLVGGINFNVLLGDHVAIHNSFSYSSYYSKVSDMDNKILAYTVESGISQISGRSDWSFHYLRHEIKTGVEAMRYLLTPGNRTPYNNESTVANYNVDEEKALEMAAYIHDNVNLSDKIGLSLGVRYSWFSKIGAAQEFHYDSGSTKSENSIVGSKNYSSGKFVKPYHGVEPRIGVKYGINENSSLKMGYHLSRQYLSLISNRSSATPSDYWKASDSNINPMISEQLSLGYFKNFNNDRIETSIEMYYKTTDNALEYKDGAVLNMNPTIEQDVINGKAQSYGIEFYIKKNSGALKGWISYTLSKSMIQADGNFEEEVINGGDFYSAYNDKLHDLTVFGHYQLTRRWNLGANFIFNTGRPATFPEKQYKYHQTNVIYYSDRNKYRLPSYHRLDVSATYEGFLKKSSKVHPSFTFSIYNIYGRDNVYSVYYKKDQNNFNMYKLSVIGVPIPSFTLNLSF